jgi:hypothetical protein
MRLLIRTCALGASICAFVHDTAIAQTVGSAVAVVPAVKGAAQPLQSGDSVFFKELIQASAGGETKLEFLDRTNLTVGSGSTVTLDRFVYDPGAGQARQFTLSMTKGAFRFVTGASEKRAYELKTPTSTMGVRGTNVLVVVKNGFTSIRVDEGSVIVCNKKAPPGAIHQDPPPRDCVTVQTGSGTTVYRNGSFTNPPVGVEGVNPGALIRQAALNPAPVAGGLTTPPVLGAGAIAGTAAAVASGAAGEGSGSPTGSANCASAAPQATLESFDKDPAGWIGSHGKSPDLGTAAVAVAAAAVNSNDQKFGKALGTMLGVASSDQGRAVGAALRQLAGWCSDPKDPSDVADKKFIALNILPNLLSNPSANVAYGEATGVETTSIGGGGGGGGGLVGSGLPQGGTNNGTEGSATTATSNPGEQIQAFSAGALGATLLGTTGTTPVTTEVIETPATVITTPGGTGSTAVSTN